MPEKILCDMSKEEMMNLIEKQEKEIKELKLFLDKNIRKEYHFYIIYFIEEVNKVYVGKTLQKNRRSAEHKNALRKGVHQNSDLQIIASKYQENSFRFEIIETKRMSDDEASKYEQNMIKEFKKTHIVLNRVFNSTFKGGRPKVFVDEELFEELYADWKNRKIQAVDAIKLLNISPGTFYRKVKEFEGLNENEKVSRNKRG